MQCFHRAGTRGPSAQNALMMQRDARADWLVQPAWLDHQRAGRALGWRDWL